MKKLLLTLFFISASAFAQPSAYTVWPGDKMVSDVISRWAMLEHKRIKWDLTEWHDNKKYAVDFELKNKDDLNRKLQLIPENNFKKKVSGLVSIFQAQNQDLEFHLCFFDEPSEILLWAHSSPNLDCTDFSVL